MDSYIPQIYKDLYDESDIVKEKAYKDYKKLKRVPVNIWRAQLQDDNPEKRVEAVCALGITRRSETAQLLIKALKDVNPFIREAAAWSLGLLYDPHSIKSLATAFNDSESKVRCEVIWSLGCLNQVADNIHEVILKETHFKALKDPSPDVRARAAHSLGWLRGNGIPEAILRAFRDEALEVRYGAAKALTIEYGFQMHALAASVSAIFSHLDKDVRIQLLRAFARFRYKETANDTILAAFQDQDSDVRATAAEILGNGIEYEIVPELVDVIDDEDPRVRRHAIVNMGYRAYMGFISAKDAYEKLTGYLDDPSEHIRAGAIDGLRGLKNRQALYRIGRMFEEDPSPIVRRAALSAICELNQYDKREYLLRGFRDSSSIVRAYVASEIGFELNIEVVEQLIELLDDYDAKVRLYAANTLNGMVHIVTQVDEMEDGYEPTEKELVMRKTVCDRAIKPLLGIWDDVDIRVPQSVYMEFLGCEEVVEPLLELAREGNRDAIYSLACDNHPDMIEPLMEQLKSEYADERGYAVSLLGKYPDPKYTDLVLSFSSDPDPLVRECVIDDLDERDDPRITDAILMLIDDENDLVRKTAVNRLCWPDTEKEVNALVKALDDLELGVRMAAARSLMSSKTPETDKALLDHFCSEKPELIKATYMYFLRKGIPGTEQDFLDAMERFGWAMADILMYCGNPILEAAGKEYYQKYGLGYLAKPRQNPPQWGSDRLE